MKSFAFRLQGETLGAFLRAVRRLSFFMRQRFDQGSSWRWVLRDLPSGIYAMTEMLVESMDSTRRNIFPPFFFSLSSFLSYAFDDFVVAFSDQVARVIHASLNDCIIFNAQNVIVLSENVLGKSISLSTPKCAKRLICRKRYYV